MNYAINKQELADKLYSGAGVAATGVLPPTSWAFNTDLKGVPVRSRQGEGAAQGRRATTASTITLDTYTDRRAATTRRAASWPRRSSSTWKTSASRREIKTGEWTQYRADRRAGKLQRRRSAAGRRTRAIPRTSSACSSTASTRAASTRRSTACPRWTSCSTQANEETDLAKRKALFNQAETTHRRRRAVAVHRPHEAASGASASACRTSCMQPTYIYYFNNVPLAWSSGLRRSADV